VKDPLHEPCKTPGFKKIKTHQRKHSTHCCALSHTHTRATQWFCCFQHSAFLHEETRTGISPVPSAAIKSTKIAPLLQAE